MYLIDGYRCSKCTNCMYSKEIIYGNVLNIFLKFIAYFWAQAHIFNIVKVKQMSCIIKVEAKFTVEVVFKKSWKMVDTQSMYIQKIIEKIFFKFIKFKFKKYYIGHDVLNIYIYIFFWIQLYFIFLRNS